MMPFLREVWGMARPYWKSSERWVARGLLFVIVGLNLGEVYISVLINQWNNDFYNSLQTVNKEAFGAALFRFSYLAAAFIIIAVYKTYLNQMLRIKWRRWLTAHWLTNWLAKQNYYRMQLLGHLADNPDQRISEDIEQFISLTLGLALGLLSSLVTLFSFLFILWGLSGPLDFMLGTTAIHIPAYMVWAALLYAIVGTWITMKIGRPLVMLNFNQQRFEADFRFSMVRLRENSESVAFYRGEAQEQAGFMSRFGFVVDNFWAIMKRQKMLNWFTSGYGQIAIIFPFVVAAPRFFAGKIQLGGLMQTASAFGQVQGALSYIVDSYASIAGWKAVTDRLSGFGDSLRHADSDGHANALTRGESDGGIEANDITIRLPSGSVLLEHVQLTIAPGDSLLITGPSGVGKSTLLRTLAGLWPFAEGALKLPRNATMLFLPQKPYLPLGTLREALYYPMAGPLPNPPPQAGEGTFVSCSPIEYGTGMSPLPEGGRAREGELEHVMALCGLSHLASQLDEGANWAQTLSLGEQQRVAIVRVLLMKPDFIFMDEATSALDIDSEARLYGLIKEQLQQVAMVSVGHRPSLRQWHKLEKILPF